jgi:hypothetical protein
VRELGPSAQALIAELKQVLAGYLGPPREAAAQRPSLFDWRGAPVERKGRSSSRKICPYPVAFYQLTGRSVTGE